MRITSINSSLLRIPLESPVADSIHIIDSVEVVTCAVETDQGIVGHGFTYTIGMGGHGIKSIIDACFVKALLGLDPLEITDIWEKMWRLVHSVGRGGITNHSIAAIDIALWDIKGKEEGKPLYRILNGTRKPIPLYDTNGGWLHYTKDQLVRNALLDAEQNFRGFKVKVGKKTVEEDLERIRAVKDAVGDRLSVMVDANQLWGKSEALRRGRKFQDLDVEWFEEPLVADDLWGHREVAKELDVAIAIGETIFTRYEFMNYMRLGACDILQQDVCRVGGITEWMRIAEMAEVNGLKVSPHFVMDLHPSLLASVPNGLYVEHIPWLGKLWKSRPKVVDGSIVPQELPGTGLEPNPDVIAKYVVL